jgi:hypothetical protein
MIILKMSQCLSKKSLAVISSESSFLIKEWTWLTRLDTEGCLVDLSLSYNGHMVVFLRTGVSAGA